MGEILIQNIFTQGITAVSNQFIDKYMLKANGEFVKIYLYLLRCTQNGQTISLAAVADLFDCTERDVIRALRYWEKAGLMQLSYAEHQLTGIAFCLAPAEEEKTEPAAEPPAEQTTAATAEPTPSPAKITSPTEPPVKISRGTLTADEKKALKEKEEVSQLLYIAEQYLGRTLSRTDVDNLLYFYSQLHFSADLIEYLVEYCVSKGSRSSRYIETVALAWAQEGISTVQEAKEVTNLHNKNYFTILRAMGIKGRNPIEMEQTLMDKWLNDYCFTLDIISEACQRTVMQTGQSSFQYTDKILTDWHTQGVRHLTDLSPLDCAHKKKAAKTSARSVSASSGNSQTDYPHRKYDYGEIAKSLFNQ